MSRLPQDRSVRCFDLSSGVPGTSFRVSEITHLLSFNLVFFLQ